MITIMLGRVNIALLYLSSTVVEALRCGPPMVLMDRLTKNNNQFQIYLFHLKTTAGTNNQNWFSSD